MGMITVREVKTKRDRRDFVEFPLKLYRGEPNFVPPLYGDEMAIFKPNCHYNEISESVFFLAFDDDKVVGRIHGILHRASNQKWDQKRVRFTRFDSVNDPKVAAALFAALEDWARSKGMEEVMGPIGFSDLEREGLLIEGFDELSTFEEQYNYAYYQALIEGLGYEKEVDWVEHQLRLPEVEDPKLGRVAQRIMERNELHMATAKNTGEFLKKYADKFFDILDLTYAEIYGTVPFTDAMKKELIKSFRQIIDLRYIIMILDKNENPVCFGLAFPSIGKALQKTGGRLTLPAVIKILRAVKSPEIIDLGLVGVVPAYRGRGVTAVLMHAMIEMLKQSRAEYYETNLNLEDNHAIINHWKMFNSRQHKRRRCYIKKI